MKTNNPFHQHHEEFLRQMYDHEREHDRKMQAVAKFLTLYAAAGAGVMIAIAILSRFF